MGSICSLAGSGWAGTSEGLGGPLGPNLCIDHSTCCNPCARMKSTAKKLSNALLFILAQGFWAKLQQFKVAHMSLDPLTQLPPKLGRLLLGCHLLQQERLQAARLQVPMETLNPQMRDLNKVCHSFWEAWNAEHAVKLGSSNRSYCMKRPKRLPDRCPWNESLGWEKAYDEQGSPAFCDVSKQVWKAVGQQQNSSCGCGAGIQAVCVML
eukprot:1161328-Pelagomonas_calceolata.AAC.6